MSTDGDLPWYLRESLGSDDHHDEDAQFVRYVGNFDKEGTKDMPTNILLEGVDVNNANVIRKEKPQLPQRQRRRPRHIEEYESDPHFTPFTGTLEDLIQSTKTIDDVTSSDSWSGGIFVIWEARWYVNTTVMIVSFVLFFAQKQRRKVAKKSKGFFMSAKATSTGSRLTDTDESHENKGNKLDVKKSPDSDDTDLPDVANLDFHTLSMSNEDDKSTDLREENTDSELCDEPVENANNHDQNKEETIVPCNSNIGQDSVSFVTKAVDHAQSSNDEFNDMIQKGIPAMAEILSKSGLNSQDSLRIATQEYLTARRCDREEQKKVQKEKIIEADAKLAKAMGQFQGTAISITFGFQFIICVMIACIFRFIFSNTKAMGKILKGDNALGQIEEIVFGWITRDVCGCLMNSNPNFLLSNNVPSIQSSSSSTWTNIAMYAINYSGIITAPSIPIPSQCALTCFLYIFFIAGAHRILRLFHCNMLHNVLNWTVMIFLLTNTVMGKSITILLLEILVYNATLCGMAHTRRSLIWQSYDKDENQNVKVQHDTKKDWGGSISVRREKLQFVEDIKRKMLLASWAGALFLGAAPVILRCL